MRLFLAALFCVLFASSAFADGRAFPPDHCSTNTPFMAFTGVDGSNTFCDSGQDVLNNALPKSICGDGQVVVKQGNGFICKDDPAAPTCPSGQVLTFLSGSGFTCVNPQASVPNCGANQFLTYSNNAFQCASVQNTVTSSCPSGQVMIGLNAGKPVCAADASADNAPCQAWCGGGSITGNKASFAGANCATPNYAAGGGVGGSTGPANTVVPTGTILINTIGNSGGTDGEYGYPATYAQCVNGNWVFVGGIQSPGN